jgi:hypothetical protein
MTHGRSDNWQKQHLAEATLGRSNTWQKQHLAEATIGRSNTDQNAILRHFKLNKETISYFTLNFLSYIVAYTT